MKPDMKNVINRLFYSLFNYSPVKNSIKQLIEDESEVKVEDMNDYCDPYDEDLTYIFFYTSSHYFLVNVILSMILYKLSLMTLLKSCLVPIF